MEKSQLICDQTLKLLPSLKPARDLTLGGLGRGGAKREFKPNLNVVRNKNSNVKTSKDTTARGRGSRGARGAGGRGAQRGGRGGGAANSLLIQTAGVFSEGAGAVNVRKAGASGASGYGRTTEESAAASLRRPTLVKSDLMRSDSKIDAMQMRELLGESDDEDDGDEGQLYAGDKTDLAQIPVRLNEAKWKPYKSETKTEPGRTVSGNGAGNIGNDELAIAQEIDSMHVAQKQVPTGTDSKALPRYPQTIDKLLLATQPQIFVMQLPDALPTCEDDCDSASETAEQSTTKLADADKPGTSAEAAHATNTPALSQSKSRRKAHPLQQLEEGQVGKLVRYKSGKIKLILGETHFDLDMGMETGFLQDLMSISTNREERSGNMINLGTIQAKVTATPDWEQLLQQLDTADKA